MSQLMRLRIPFLLLLALAGCASSEQFERPGTWKLPPTGQGANDANLRTMIVNPHDLIAGVDEPGSVATEAVHPIDLLMTGRRRPLPNVNASSIGASGGGGGGGGGAGGQ
jgi:hypothetical protein